MSVARKENGNELLLEGQFGMNEFWRSDIVHAAKTIRRKQTF